MSRPVMKFRNRITDRLGVEYPIVRVTQGWAVMSPRSATML